MRMMVGRDGPQGPDVGQAVVNQVAYELIGDVIVGLATVVP